MIRKLLDRADDIIHVYALCVAAAILRCVRETHLAEIVDCELEARCRAM